MPSVSAPPIDLSVTLLYKNWRGETAFRRVKILSHSFGSTEYHPEPCDLLKGIDLERNVERDFAVNNILGWRSIDYDTLVFDLNAALYSADILLSIVKVSTQTEKKIRAAIEAVLDDSDLLREAAKSLDEETCLRGIQELGKGLTKAIMDLRGNN